MRTKRKQKTITKICKICGKQFQTDKNAQTFCSSKCRKKAKAIWNKKSHTEHIYTINCAWCGETFTTERKRKYCCRLCQLRANGRIKGIAPKTKNKPTKSLEEVAKICSKLNITYGQYMTQYGDEM